MKCKNCYLPCLDYNATRENERLHRLQRDAVDPAVGAGAGLDAKEGAGLHRGQAQTAKGQTAAKDSAAAAQLGGAKTVLSSGGRYPYLFLAWSSGGRG